MFQLEFQWSLVNERSGQLLISRGILFYPTQIIMHLLLETLSTVTVLIFTAFPMKEIKVPKLFQSNVANEVLTYTPNIFFKNIYDFRNK